VKRVLWHLHMGLGLWQSCGGQLSILGQWGGDRRQKRFPIRNVQALLGLLKRGLRQMQVGLGLWQRCVG